MYDQIVRSLFRSRFTCTDGVAEATKAGPASAMTTGSLSPKLSAMSAADSEDVYCNNAQDNHAAVFIIVNFKLHNLQFI